jgi:Ni,Fe-hydrogenase I cytochrome b subunit
MENITQGHWIFAAIFAIVGIAGAYIKDAKIHKIHYKGFYVFFAALIIAVFLLFVFKDFLR